MADGKFPNDWYWAVAGSTAQVFSSARGIYVAASDADYAAWQALGYHAVNIGSEQELLAVLAAHGLVAQIPAALGAYAQQKQAALAAGGVSVNVGAPSAPINVEASTDPTSLILLQGAYTLAQANSQAAFSWVQENGTAVTLTSAQIATVFNAVTAFMQATFTTLAGVLAGIAANPPTVTTRAQVDTPPAPIPAWPENS